MRVLLGTNQLERIAGSEVVTLEYAQYFKSVGVDVTVYANWLGRPMSRFFGDLGVRVVMDPREIKPLAYDLVYLQHQVAPLFDYSHHADERAHSRVVFGRLSAKSFLESSGWAYEAALGDALTANCTATADGMRQAGATLPIHVCHNAAPAAYHQPAVRALPDAPRTIAIVTNHIPPSLREAVPFLRRDADVVHVGRGGDCAKLVTPEMIRDTDLVVTIGKTVQYALASRTPVFVYDHFGGPGYLDDANFALASHRNFNGSCTPRAPSGEALAREIIGGYAGGKRFAEAAPRSLLDTYFLPAHLDRLLKMEPSSNEVRRIRLRERAPEIERERMTAAYVRDQYAALHDLRRRYKRLTRNGSSA